MADGATRGHSLKLFQRRVRLDVAGESINLVSGWCTMNGTAVMAGNLVNFTAKLDHHLRNVSGFV